MSAAGLSGTSFANSRAIAVTMFALLFAGLGIATWTSLANIVEQREELARNEALLEQLRSRGGARGAGAGATAGRPGSPFLEGPSLTVAGATLLQRVAAAVTQAGGTVQSSQINVEGAQAKAGFVGLLMIGEADQIALQKILYDIEAGMPYLFIDQLDVQMPQAAAANQAAPGKARIILGVSGQWLRRP